jgi:hypothetical protein
VKPAPKPDPNNAEKIAITVSMGAPLLYETPIDHTKLHGHFLAQLAGKASNLFADRSCQFGEQKSARLVR